MQPLRGRCMSGPCYPGVLRDPGLCYPTPSGYKSTGNLFSVIGPSIPPPLGSPPLPPPPPYLNWPLPSFFGARNPVMGEKDIFTIENLPQAYGKREVLKNIWLAFYPGAKIGVIGSNGAGKSTLLRVMALAEKDFVGSARPADGIRIGFVPQEPRLDETKDVRGNIEEAVAPVRALLNRHEELSIKLSEPLDPD